MKAHTAIKIDVGEIYSSQEQIFILYVKWKNRLSNNKLNAILFWSKIYVSLYMQKKKYQGGGDVCSVYLWEVGYGVFILL